MLRSSLSGLVEAGPAPEIVAVPPTGYGEGLYGAGIYGDDPPPLISPVRSDLVGALYSSALAGKIRSS